MPLACLISDTYEQRDKLSNKAVRILLRLAAIIDCGVSTLISVNQDQLNSMGLQDKNNSDTILQIQSWLLNDVSGTGRTQLRWGALWVALGLWQHRFLKDPQFNNGNFKVARSVIYINRIACQQVARSIAHQLLYAAEACALLDVPRSYRLYRVANECCKYYWEKRRPLVEIFSLILLMYLCALSSTTYEF